MNFIERLQSKLYIKNYIFRKENLIIELNDATYQLNLNKSFGSIFKVMFTVSILFYLLN